MRIITGKFRGKQIHPPGSLRARPTTDFAKESLFNIIENSFKMQTLDVLDLFAGTGSISYEFASRGAAAVETVELDLFHSRFIRKTIHDLAFEQVRVVRADAFRYLKHCSSQYDIIFADPPYDLKGIESLPHIIFERKLLKPHGWLIIEHGRNTRFEDHPKYMQGRQYGSVHFTFFA